MTAAAMKMTLHATTLKGRKMSRILFLCLLSGLAMTSVAAANDVTSVDQPNLSISIAAQNPIRLNQFDPLQISVSLQGPHPDPTQPPVVLRVPEQAVPEVVFATEDNVVARFRMDQQKPNVQEPQSYWYQASNGERSQRWTHSYVTWNARFKTMSDELPAGRYTVYATFPESGAIATSTLEDVVIEPVTFEQAKAAHEETEGERKVWISTGHAEGARLHNRSGRAIVVVGYVNRPNPVAKPTEPAFTFMNIETYQPGGFQQRSYGYCGTGAGAITLEDNSTIRLQLHQVALGYFRYALSYSFADGSNDGGIAYSDVQRYERLPK